MSDAIEIIRETLQVDCRLCAKIILLILYFI
jgi:hypothetical protein